MRMIDEVTAEHQATLNHFKRYVSAPIIGQPEQRTDARKRARQLAGPFPDDAVLARRL